MELLNKKNNLNKIIVLFFGLICIAIILSFNVQKYYKDVFQVNLNESHSCATFMIDLDDHIVIGHNLDDYCETYGLVFINNRGVKKSSISWKDLGPGPGFRKKDKRIEWVSKYGSITYNTWGKEFIDGGVNEKGLYIGEMTMFGTKYPKDKSKVSIHHHFYMQYILDNYASVQEFLDNFDKVNVDGHCQWHYFIADKTGKVAIMEFYDNVTHIYTDEKVPVKALCNRKYENELAMIPDSQDEYYRMLNTSYYEKDLRFMAANQMIKNYKNDPEDSVVNYSFSILEKMNFGNNRWQIVYNLTEMKMYFRTNQAHGIKTVDFNSFDFECKSPIKIFDIHSDKEGDVSSQFINYSEELNLEYLKKNFNEIDFGFMGNLLLKKPYYKRINEYTNKFKCE